MALTLVLGPANSAKAGEVLGAYAATAQRGALLIVPTAADARHYSRELAEQGCVLASVLTFTGLAEEIARRARYFERRLTRIQRERALERVVEAARLSVLREAAATTGFPAAVGELVAELERALVSPARFAQAMRKWGEEDERRSGLARDIGSLDLAYADELERLGRVDPELFLWRALDALRGAPGAWGATPVFFYGFDDLTALERDAVESLARVAGAEVTVSLTYEAGKAAVRARAGLVEDLRPFAERVIELPAVDDYYEPESREALHHLERWLFEPALSERIDPGGAIRLLESAGERAEAELVAAEILSLLLEGVAAEEIAVVYRALDGVAPLVAHVLGRYGVRASFARRIPFGHTALGRGVLALARCALLPEEQATASDVLAYLRAPGVLDRPEKADALEAEVIRGRLRSAAQARERFDFELREIDALRHSEDPRGELLRHARRLLSRPHRQSAARLDAEEALDAHALAAMARALDELSDVHEQLSGSELIELLEDVEVDASGDGGPGAVLLAEPLAIRARRFRAVFVCGLQEGGFPRLPGPDPFLPDERKRELAASSGLVLPMVEDALDRERYLFYASVSRATERVILSYRSSDEEGNLELASPFVSDVADLLDPDWRDRRRRRLLGDLVWPADQAPTDRERARSEVASSSAGGGAPLVQPETRRLGDAALALVRHTQLVSAGGLESYSACAFKWLVENELQASELEPEPDPLTRGSYIHEVLEQLLSRLGTAVTAESLPRALEILQELTSELPDTVATGRPERLREAIGSAIAADLRRYLVHEAAGGGDWEPRHLELRFGFAGKEDDEGESLPQEDGESLPALELGEGAERVSVRGVIDRVDVDPEGRRAIVRDYKSGGHRQEWAGDRWSGDGSLQVALYMLAVRDLLGLEPVAGLYQPLSGRDLRARGVYLEGAPVGSRPFGNDKRDEAELAAELEDAQRRARELAGRLRSGELTASPDSCSRNGCLYPGICRST
jgi:ATP-dependent helicase/DNAse subunit B